MQVPKRSQTVIPVEPKSDRGWRMISLLGLWGLVILLAFAATLVALYFMRRVGLPGLGGRYILLALWLFLIVVDLGIRYVRDAFGLVDYRSAARWLLASMGTPSLSTLKVWDTSLKTDPLEKPNLIKTVGGPGSVTVAAGLVALVECLDGNIRILEKGTHTLGRLERVKEVIKPDEVVTDQVEKKRVITRDGIGVDATNIHFHYRLNRTDMTLEDAFKRRVYNLALDAKGEADWGGSVRGAVTGPITSTIADNELDYLIASGFSKNSYAPTTPGRPPARKTDPRADIINRVNTKGKSSLSDIGAELLWFDIGHFELPPEVNAKLTETWQKTWEGKLGIFRAQKEVARMRFRRAYTLGRTEAQIDLLIKIVKGLDGLSSKTELPPNSSNIYVTGLTQLLDALGQDALENRNDQNSNSSS